MTRSYLVNRIAGLKLYTNIYKLFAPIFCDSPGKWESRGSVRERQTNVNVLFSELNILFDVVVDDYIVAL